MNSSSAAAVVLAIGMCGCSYSSSAAQDQVTQRQSQGAPHSIEKLVESTRYRVPVSSVDNGYLVASDGELVLVTQANEAIKLPAQPSKNLMGSAPQVLVYDVNNDGLFDFFIKDTEGAPGACYALLIQSGSDTDKEVTFNEHSDGFCNPEFNNGNASVISVRRSGPFSDIDTYLVNSEQRLYESSKEKALDFDFSEYIVWNDRGDIVGSDIVFRGTPDCGVARARISKSTALSRTPALLDAGEVSVDAGELVQISAIVDAGKDLWAKIELIAQPTVSGWVPRSTLSVSDDLVANRCSEMRQ